jgi:hypothetical protein
LIGSETSPISACYANMENNVVLLLNEVERLVMHLRHRVPPEIASIDEIVRLVDEMRSERNEQPKKK